MESALFLALRNVATQRENAAIKASGAGSFLEAQLLVCLTDTEAATFWLDWACASRTKIAL
jgi:hypothetical protein